MPFLLMIFTELETNNVSGSIDKFKSIVPDAMSAEDWFRYIMTTSLDMQKHATRFMHLTVIYPIFCFIGFTAATTMVKPL